MWHKFKLSVTKWFISLLKSQDGLFATLLHSHQRPFFVLFAPRHSQVLDAANIAAPCPRTHFPSLPLLCASRRCFIFPQECCNSLPILPNPSASALPHHHCHSPRTPHRTAETPRWAASALFSRQHWVWWRDCWWSPFWCLHWDSGSQEKHLIVVFYQSRNFTCLPEETAVRQNHKK